ncbi:MAG: 16S rRNA (uracil(1498)-N(3))-methyltransferase [Tannerella sp.]|jgi:16S rRNA (uracil1498-N3)-methyltransferase|nr:16S rRNA (uracil(1498)-N(3))-methyltransferase [Tannerella sp.]
MENLFYAPEISQNPVLPEEESSHCARVLRLKKGDAITVTDGKGYFYKAVLQGVNSKQCPLQIIRTEYSTPDFTENIHIAVAPTKNIDRMEWFVEKATEVGISQITFMRCQHSERKEVNLSRIRKIAVSAMKQSQKAILPEINEIIDFKQFINQNFNGTKMIAHCENTDRQPIKTVYSKHTDTIILIGPEGDFTSEEIQIAINHGFIPITLGNSRLRTETAALTAFLAIHFINN